MYLRQTVAWGGVCGAVAVQLSLSLMSLVDCGTHGLCCPVPSWLQSLSAPCDLAAIVMTCVDVKCHDTDMARC